MAQPDSAYYRARERAERAAAKKAGSDAARRVHEELAEAYARRLQPSSRPSPKQVGSSSPAG